MPTAFVGHWPTVGGLGRRNFVDRKGKDNLYCCSVGGAVNPEHGENEVVFPNGAGRLGGNVDSVQQFDAGDVNIAGKQAESAEAGEQRTGFIM